MPPADFVFEELIPGMEVKTNVGKRNSWNRRRSKQVLNAEKGSINYFQKKRELEKKIEVQESDLLKGEFCQKKFSKIYKLFFSQAKKK